MKNRCALVLSLFLALPAMAAQPVTPPLQCNPIGGIDKLLEAGRVLLLGEFHGTAESPGFVSDLACLAEKAGRPVTVALEIPVDEDARVQTFLASAGSDADRQALLSGPFWQAEYQDGRRSQAMLGLIESLRKLRQGPAPLHVVLLDSPGIMTDAGLRDRAMADRLKGATAERPQDLFVVLTGNIHNRLARGVPWDAKYEPMGFVLSQSSPKLRLTSLDASYSGGTAWSCETPDAASCKSRPLGGKARGKGREVVLWDAVDKDGYSGIYNVDVVTASPPAKQSTKPGV